MPVKSAIYREVFSEKLYRLSCRPTIRTSLLCAGVLLACAVHSDIALAQNDKEETAAQRQQAEPTAIATDEWAVRLAPGADIEAIAAGLGAIDFKPVGTLKSTYVLTLPNSKTRAAATQNTLRNTSAIVWFEQQIARQRSKKVIPTDPLFQNQWHLRNTGQSGGTSGQDANVVPVWDGTPSYTGSGVVIGVIDDGLQHTHPDLSPNYLAGASFDFNDNDPDPTPASTDGHGTSAAGVAAAADDGSSCGVGAAFDAQLAGLRLISAPSTDAQEASALTHQQNTIDIYNNSWGPPDSGTLGPIGPLAAAALLDSVNNGRNGLGTLHMWAAGNGLQNLDNVNYDAYANSPYTIAVGAVGHNGNQAFYSEPGAAMLITAPSNGGGAGITTTDLLGSAGYDAGDCTNGFGGTSSSTPLAAGVVALMLQANPNLTWRDVQHILVETAVRNDPTDGDWSTNGANRLINHKYGFGRIDAQAAVGTARTWNNVAAASRFSTPVDSVNQAIPDNNPTGVSASLVVNNNLILEHVEIVFNATHPFRGDLVVTLTSPAGTESVLAERRNDNGDNYNDWRFMTVRNWGETANGTWTLQVSDADAQNTGSFNSWQLILHGTAVATGNQIFSDQFEDS